MDSLRRKILVGHPVNNLLIPERSGKEQIRCRQCSSFNMDLSSLSTRAREDNNMIQHTFIER